jgi:hypothetical protein
MFSTHPHPDQPGTTSRRAPLVMAPGDLIDKVNDVATDGTQDVKNEAKSDFFLTVLADP